MIVKFHARGAGGGAGPVEYLLGKDGQRAHATLDRGNPDQITELINSSKYAKKYTSGVLSFAEPNLDRAVKDQIMSSFEHALLPGLDTNQYSILWVEHLDKGRLELNFVVPNVELHSGKRLQPYYHAADKPRINAWKTGINIALDLHDPDDPINRQNLVTPRDLPKEKQSASQAITDGLLTMAVNGQIDNRQTIIDALTTAGFNIARQTPKSISIKDPEGGRNIRLKGKIFEQDFNLGPDLQSEIEGASNRYRRQSKARNEEARTVYQRGFDIKRKENQRRHPRPYQTNDAVSTQTMDTNGYQHSVSFTPGTGADHLAVDNYSKPKKTNIGPTQPEPGMGNTTIRSNLRTVYSTKPRSKTVVGDDGHRAKSVESGEKLNDGIGANLIGRIRELARTTQNATDRITASVRQLAENVRHYMREQQDIEQASKRLAKTSADIERKTITVKSSAARHKNNKGGGISMG